MDAGLGVRWPLSPFATAIAAGALVAAFCVALWKQHFNLKRRRNSAPESTHKDSKLKDLEKTEQSLSLSKSSSDPSLNIPKENKKLELGLISNFLRQSNVYSPAGHSISSVRLPYISNLELRPLTLCDDLKRLPRYTKIYSVPDYRKGNHPKFGTIFGINFHELVLRENVSFLGSIYSHLKPLSRRNCPFIGRHYISRPECLNINYKSIYLPLSETAALTRPHVGWNNLEGPITRAVKSVVKEEDFYSLHRDRKNPNLRKRKNITSDEKIINDDYNVLETETKERADESPVIIKENNVLETKAERVESPVLVEDFISNTFFGGECLLSSENGKEQNAKSANDDYIVIETKTIEGAKVRSAVKEYTVSEKIAELEQNPDIIKNLTSDDSFGGECLPSLKNSIEQNSKNVNDDYNVLQTETEESADEQPISMEENNILETETERVESPVVLKDFASNYSFGEDSFPYAENGEKRIGKNVNVDYNVLKTKTKESAGKLTVSMEENVVLETEDVESPVVLKDFAPNYSFGEGFPCSVNGKKQNGKNVNVDCNVLKTKTKESAGKLTVSMEENVVLEMEHVESSVVLKDFAPNYSFGEGFPCSVNGEKRNGKNVNVDCNVLKTKTKESAGKLTVSMEENVVLETERVESTVVLKDFAPNNSFGEESLSFSENGEKQNGKNVNYNVLKAKTDKSAGKQTVGMEENLVLETERVESPVTIEDFASNYSLGGECLPSSETGGEQLTVEGSKEAPSAFGNCHDIKRTEQECDTLHEVEKSINSTQASDQKPRPTKENLEDVQEDGDKGGGVMTTRKNELSFALETKQTIWIGEPNSAERPNRGTIVGGDEGEEQQQIRSAAFRVTNDRDVTGVADGGRGEARSRTPDEGEARSAASQMDCGSGKQSVDDAAAAGRNTGARVFESSVTSETRIRPGGVSTVVSSVTVDDTDHLWSSQEIDTILDSMSLKTVITTDHTFVDRGEGGYRPTFEEFIPVQSPHGDTTLEDTIKELNEIAGRPLVLEESPPRVSRLLGLLSRDEERRARAEKIVEEEGASIDGEWDRILRNVLASVSELERWEGNGKEEEPRRRRHDVSPLEDAEDDRQHPPRHSRSSLSMEEEATLPTPKGETPTKVKNLRFKLDPDIFDVPSDDSFYDDDDEREVRWKKQPRYRAFSTLELGDEPVKLVSVHASVVPAGQKMVARPVGIDLRVRLTEERQSKRAHVGSSPSQAKRRSPVSENRIGWCQELSPVTENVDWRENFQSVSKENNINNNNVTESKPVPNGILKTPSPKTETVSKDSANPFKEEVKLTNGKLTNGVTTHEKPKPVPNGVHHWNAPPKRLSLPRKKFEPDPEAVERITGYKIALSKPPIPPPVFPKMTSPISKNRAEIARKQYLDSKAALSQQKADGTKKFQQFLTQAQNDRARIVTSVPDLGAIEKAVNEKWAKERASASQRQSPAREELAKSVETPSSRGSTPDDAWTSYVQSCRKHLGRRSQSLSYLETDIDIPVAEDDDKWRSTSALDEPDSDDQPLPVGDSDFEQSREDLDDSGRAKSEHELRIQRSLQSMPLPDWYKRSDKTKTGFLLKSGEKEKRGWAAAKSLASSTSSLASCGLRRPVHSLRSSRENIPWSRGSSSPDGPTLSIALARAFREPYLGWRARTSTSSGVSSSPRTSPPSWCAATTDSEVNGVSFDGEDAFGPTSSEDGKHEEPPSLDDTGADAVTVSMDTGELIKLPGGEDTCDDINNMSMETCEMFDTSIVPDVDEPSPQADTGDDIDNLSTDTTEDKKKDPKFKRYSYSQSIYHSEWDDEESRGERKIPKEDREGSPSSDSKVIWIESSFVGSRTTTSIMVLPEEKEKLERPASR